MAKYSLDNYDTDSEMFSLIVDKYIYSERNRKILKRRFVDGIHFEPLSEEFNLSVEQIKNIVYKSFDKICKYL